MDSIHPVHTPCKNCSFAQYEAKTQIGCSFGFIDKFRNNGIEVLEVFDEDKEFYVINNKKCLAHKEDNYFISRNMSEATIEEKMSYVKSFLQVKYLAIIDCLSRNEKQLQSIIDELNRAETKPNMIMVISSRSNTTDLKTFYKTLDRSGYKWKMKSLATNEQDHITTVHQVINLGAEKCNFVLSIQEDYSKIQEIIHEANKIIYDKNSSFSVISNESKKTIFFNTSLYKAGLMPDSKDIITNYEKYTIL